MTIGPMVAWRRVTPAGLWRVLAAPVAFAAFVGVVLAAATNAADSLPSLLMFCLSAAGAGAWWSRSSRAAPRRGG